MTVTPTADTPAPITPEQLAKVPSWHRQLIARWLTERATHFQPSWLCPENVSQGIQGALSGAAVDLATPGEDDSTTSHSAEVLAALHSPHELLTLIEEYAAARGAQVEQLHATGDPALMDTAERVAVFRLDLIRDALGVEADQ